MYSESWKEPIANLNLFPASRSIYVSSAPFSQIALPNFPFCRLWDFQYTNHCWRFFPIWFIKKWIPIIWSNQMPASYSQFFNHRNTCNVSLGSSDFASQGVLYLIVCNLSTHTLIWVIRNIFYFTNIFIFEVMCMNNIRNNAKRRLEAFFFFILT